MQLARIRWTVQLLLGLCAIALCWADVCWALRPGLFPVFDELNNPTLFLAGSYRQFFHFFPDTFYGNRPVGWAFIKLLADLFPFNYTAQVACLLAIHFGNCCLAFLLFRRLGAGIPIAIAGVALFGSLATTALTATYIGASFDVICLFFLLGSVLTMLWERRGAGVLSAVLFLLALRTKEFAIVTPLLLTVLVALRLPLAAVVRRLWMHYAILLAFGLRYLVLFARYQAGVAHDNPYYLDPHPVTALKSLAWYTALVFGADESHWQLPPLVLALGLGAVLVWAVLRRRAGIAFGVCAFVLTLLPVCLMPNQRTPLYVYAPQVFLILALCLLAEEAFALFGKRERRRWLAAVCIAVACMWWCVAFRRSAYFRARVSLNLMYRRATWRTAHDVDTRLPPMGPGAHVYVNRIHDTGGWLVVPWPCTYLQLVNRQRGIACVVDQPADQLRQLYANDAGPKYFVDYRDDGSFTVAAGNR